jgi:hypothetical protein
MRTMLRVALGDQLLLVQNMAIVHPDQEREPEPDRCKGVGF